MIDAMHGALKRHASAYSSCGCATAFASIVLDTFTPDLAMAFSSRSAKSSAVKTAVAESLGL